MDLDELRMMAKAKRVDNEWTDEILADLLDGAADEIERLRADDEELRSHYKYCPYGDGTPSNLGED